MAKDETLGSLFGKVKKWANQELKNATKIGGDPREHHRADEENEDLARQIERDAEQLRDDAIVAAITPQSLKDYQAASAANRATRDSEYAARLRAERQARAGASSVELSGFVTGTAEGLAVDPLSSDDTGSMHVTVECVDPVPMQGGTLVGFNFTIPGFHGDGTYPLLDHAEFDGLQYELFLAEENDGWAFHPTYGPGTIVVNDGVADVRLTIGNSGSDVIHLHGSISLSPS